MPECGSLPQWEADLLDDMARRDMRSREDAQAELRMLLRKTRGLNSRARLCAVISWACGDLSQMEGLLREDDDAR